MERKAVQDAYIRLCGDSGFRMDMVKAARFTARVLGIHAIEVWVALGLDNMERIANGTHPCLKRKAAPTGGAEEDGK